MKTFVFPPVTQLTLSGKTAQLFFDPDLVNEDKEHTHCLKVCINIGITNDFIEKNLNSSWNQIMQVHIFYAKKPA